VHSTSAARSTWRAMRFTLGLDPKTQLSGSSGASWRSDSIEGATVEDISLFGHVDEPHRRIIRFWSYLRTRSSFLSGLPLQCEGSPSAVRSLASHLWGNCGENERTRRPSRRQAPRYSPYPSIVARARNSSTNWVGKAGKSGASLRIGRILPPFPPSWG
jgi:hypothetical protein